MHFHIPNKVVEVMTAKNNIALVLSVFKFCQVGLLIFCRFYNSKMFVLLTLSVKYFCNLLLCHAYFIETRSTKLHFTIENKVFVSKLSQVRLGARRRSKL